MPTRMLFCRIVLILAVLGLKSIPPAEAKDEKDKPKGDAGPPVTRILDTRSYWRIHVTVKPPLYGTQADAKLLPKLLAEGKLKDDKGIQKRAKVIPPDQPDLPWPPADWASPDFDDSAWWRDGGPFYGGTRKRCSSNWNPWPHLSRHGTHQAQSLALLCARARFTVTDPSKVKDLKLSLDYRGGIVVYLNGKEALRSNMPKGEVQFDTPAEDYSIGAYVDRKASLLRVRQVENAPLPAKLLKKGVNVLGIEVHRTARPSTEDMKKQAEAAGKKMPRRGAGAWSTVAFMDMSLTTSAPDGIAPNVSRPAGTHVWNADPLRPIILSDYGDFFGVLKPVRIVGARNGICSGQVVVSSDGKITGLNATIGALKHESGKGTLAASSVRIRYPSADVRLRTTCAVVPMRWAWHDGPLVKTFDGLLDNPPAAIERKEIKGRRSTTVEHPVQPIWITVSVPKDAAAGKYTGTLAVQWDGGKPVSIPVVLEVHGFVCPSPKDFETWIDFVQSPDTLAAYYNVPLWSEEHWALIEQTFDLLAAAGNRAIFLPLLCKSHFGNEESMVRWIKKGEDTYSHDFGIAERYIDLALKSGIEPEIVCLHVWDYHVERGVGKGDGGVAGGNKYGPKTPVPAPVTMFDPSTKTASEMQGPAYSDPKAKAFWKPVADGLRAMLKKRGLEEKAMLGIALDWLPSQKTTKMWAELMPGTPWMKVAHGGKMKDIWGAPIGYAAHVMDVSFAIDPAVQRFHGWQRPDRKVFLPRVPWVNGMYFRLVAEIAIQGKQVGAGRMPADFFPPQKNMPGSLKKYRRIMIGARYSKARSLSIIGTGNLGATHLISAGEKGPIPTVRFEMLREGIQECEARIFIEKALADDKLRAKLGEKLAARCQEILDGRTRMIAWAHETVQNMRKFSYLPGGALGFRWYIKSGWQDRSAKLYSAAAEVAGKLGGA